MTMHLKYFLKIIITLNVLQANMSFSEIPEIIKKYIDTNHNAAQKQWPNSISQEQSSLILKDMRNKIISRFEKLAPEIDDKVSDELLDYLISKFVVNKEEKPEKTIIKKVKEISLLQDKYSGKLWGKNLHLRYKNTDIPITFKKITSETPSDFRLKIVGIPMPIPNNNTTALSKECLFMKIDLNKYHANLIWLGSFETACPLPEQKKGQGEFLLTLAEDIAKTMNMKSISLKDGSRVYCPYNQKMANFRILRVFQHKPGWYESKGYSLAKAKNKLTSQTKNLTELKISDIEPIIEIASKDPKKNGDVTLYKNQIERFKSLNQSSRIADFMSWLWGVNCANYMAIFDLIFKSENMKYIDISFYPEYIKNI